MSSDASQWIFGYGSLIFRPAFRSTRREAGFIHGFVRRFWQGSTDHRGTEDAPGRVATLVPRADGRCWGVAYELPREEADDILAALDVREQGGYSRLAIDVTLGAGRRVSALTYYADANNRNFIGEASVEEIAAVARLAAGPSGKNRDYILQLAKALAEMDAEDPHVSAIAALL